MLVTADIGGRAVEERSAEQSQESCITMILHKAVQERWCAGSLYLWVGSFNWVLGVLESATRHVFSYSGTYLSLKAWSLVFLYFRFTSHLPNRGIIVLSGSSTATITTGVVGTNTLKQIIRYLDSVVIGVNK